MIIGNTKLSIKELKLPRVKRIRLNAEDRRQQLINIAVNITAIKGLCKTKHAEIAEEAGIAVSTVFFYFPTVDDLNYAILDVVETVLENLTLTNLINDSPHLSLDVLLHQYFLKIDEIIDTNNAVYTIFLEWANAVNSPVWPKYLDFRERELAAISRVLTINQVNKQINNDLDVRQTAIFISSVLTQAFRMKLFADSEPAIKELYNCIDNYLFK